MRCVATPDVRLSVMEMKWGIIPDMGGLAPKMPFVAVGFVMAGLASLGLPGMNGFIGEFLVMVGVFQSSTWVAMLIATGVILGAAYMLWLYRRIIFGELVKEDLKTMLDLSLREKIVFAPLLVLVFWMGIYPISFTSIFGPTVTDFIQDYTPRMEAQTAPAAARATRRRTGDVAIRPVCTIHANASTTATVSGAWAAAAVNNSANTTGSTAGAETIGTSSARSAGSKIDMSPTATVGSAASASRMRR